MLKKRSILNWRFCAIEEESKTIDPELIITVHKAIDDLPLKTSIVVRQILIEGKKYKEVAEENEISVNTVKTLLANGLKQLRRLFANSSVLSLFIKFVLDSKK